jgi:2,3-bisphosphoglycerate-independent phosphoglycerate mutase
MPTPRPRRAAGEARIRHALIVLDGLGDRGHPDLAGRTPLEAAKTPCLDRLAREGTLGTVLPVGPGVAPESDAGVLGLLGYDPRADSPGRGVLEAEGVGIHVEPGHVAFRFNFATVAPDGRVLDSRVGRALTTPEARRLAEALTGAALLEKEGVEARVVATVGHRGVVVLRDLQGRPLSPEVSNSDPFYVRQGGLGHAVRPKDPRVLRVEALDPAEGSRRTAELVNTLIERAPAVLRASPVNSDRKGRGQLEATQLLLRDAGTAPRHLRSFRERWGVEGAALTEMPVERGLAKLLALEDVYVGPVDPTARVAGYRERASRCRELLERHDFLYVHLKGPDEPGHDGDAPRKREIVEALDEGFFAPFLEGLDLSRVRLLITADHATPCILKAHSDDPVPVIFAGGSGWRPSDALGDPPKFCEALAAKGPLAGLLGKDLLTHLFSPRPSG